MQRQATDASLRILLARLPELLRSNRTSTG